MKSKKATVTPITAPAPIAKRPAALSLPLIAGLFAEAGVLLRPGRADVIAGSLGGAVAKFRMVAHKLAFEREPGLFPAVVETAVKKKGGRT